MKDGFACAPLLGQGHAQTEVRPWVVWLNFQDLLEFDDRLTRPPLLI